MRIAERDVGCIFPSPRLLAEDLKKNSLNRPLLIREKRKEKIPRNFFPLSFLAAVS